MGAGSDLASRRAALAEFIAAASQARRVEVTDLQRLAGGAVQQNWRLEAHIEGGRMPGSHRLLVRADAPSAIPESHSRADEFRILQAVHAAGVRVPEPLWLCRDPQTLGRPFYICRWLPGTAAGHRLVRDLPAGAPRETLVGRLARELARIHGLTPGPGVLDFLPLPTPDPVHARVARYRHYLDRLPDAYPALEWGLRWCELNAPPPPSELVLVHRDFRTGNFLVDEGELTGILDWEFTGWGDPMEDIGWFCARCWRFGAYENEAGGLTAREPFYRAYEEASGRRIDAAAVHYWEIMAHVRWAVIALYQAERHISGSERSLELALTGRIAAECELEVLLLTDRAEGRVA